MPDPKDYDYLYQVGENSYADPWGSADWGRSLFGNPQPRVLTSQEEVTVQGEVDDSEPYPKNMADIYLGTKTLPPTGTYTPPMANKPNPTVNPALQSEWGKLTRDRPFARNFVGNVDTKLYPRETAKGIVPDDSILGSQSGNNVFINADLPYDNPSQVPRTLSHELTHAAQYKQFPDDKRNDEHYGMRLPYQYRPGEELARTVSNQKAVSDAFRTVAEGYVSGKVDNLPGWMMQEPEFWKLVDSLRAERGRK